VYYRNLGFKKTGQRGIISPLRGLKGGGAPTSHYD